MLDCCRFWTHRARYGRSNIGRSLIVHFETIRRFTAARCRCRWLFKLAALRQHFSLTELTASLSLGAHFRSDFPEERDPWKRHQSVARGTL